MKLNLGCGERYVPGWVNVDLPGMPHRVDRSVDLAGPLPWAPASVECVYAGHVLEHMTEVNAVSLLARLRPLMQPGMPIMLVGPDLDAARGMFSGPDVPDEFGITLNALRHGAGRWAGDVHLWECTAAKLEDMLERAGWSSVTSIGIDTAAVMWPVADARPRWQCAVGALAPR